MCHARQAGHEQQSPGLLHLIVRIPSSRNRKTGSPKWASGFLARQKGFEPPTFRLGGGRSIRLSYWRMDMCIIREKRLAVKGGSVRKKRKMPLYR